MSEPKQIEFKVYVDDDPALADQIRQYLEELMEKQVNLFFEEFEWPLAD